LPRVVAAPDKFRGALTAREAAEAIARGARRAEWACDLAPLSDGGEGFLDVFAGWGNRRTERVVGPLGQPVEAQWLLGRGPDDPAQLTAVVETATAIGITLAGGPSGNDPVRASSKGAGQLVLAAVRAGARQVVVGMGGSATTDGGLGAVEVLAARGRPVGTELLVACDVGTRFVEAAAEFSPQKGAVPRAVELLERRLERVAQLYRERFGVDVRALPGGGAAGGLAGGLAAIGARLVPGFDLVAERLALAERIAGADLVVTGEGYLDRQSFAGKAVGGVVGLAAGAGVPVLVVVGDVEPGTEAGAGASYVSLVRRYGADRAFSAAAACISEVVGDWLAPGCRG
jgi:glycerate kinase